ncbi:MAG: hypothetical protein ACRYE7_00320 [Janthinobacterium lividum]
MPLHNIKKNLFTTQLGILVLHALEKQFNSWLFSLIVDILRKKNLKIKNKNKLIFQRYNNLSMENVLKF